MAMTREAVEILKSAIAGAGEVAHLQLPDNPGVSIKVDGTEFVPVDADHQIAARYTAGVEELQQRGYIRHHGTLFSVTESGRDAMDTVGPLRAHKDRKPALSPDEFYLLLL